MTKTFRTPEDLSLYLDSLNFFHMDLSLGRMDKVLHAMNLARPPYAVCQVVGTNGKGSTATFLASLLQAHGVNVGLYTSPHFYSPAERIQINGQWTDMADWLDAASEAVSICPDLTYFEILTVVALALFRKKGVQAAVLEAGLGAEHDATTAAANDLAVFAPIALDHTALLGSTAEAIAREKSHAVRSQIPVVSAEQEDSVLAVLSERAARFGTSVQVAHPLPSTTHLGMLGRHQFANAGTALCALKALAPSLSLSIMPEAAAKGLADAFLPGRLQIVPAKEAAGQNAAARPCCLLDGAHNPHGMASLTTALKEGVCKKPATVVYSCLADKDWRTGLTSLAKQVPGATWYIPLIPGERSEKPENIIAFLNGLGAAKAAPYPSLKDAFLAMDKTALENMCLVTGSLYLLAEFYAVWPDALHRQHV